MNILSAAYQNQQIEYTNICSTIFEEKRRKLKKKMKKFGKKNNKNLSNLLLNRKILPLSLCVASSYRKIVLIHIKQSIYIVFIKKNRIVLFGNNQYIYRIYIYIYKIYIVDHSVVDI